MIVPDTWSSLEEFARWYQDNNFPLRVPSNAFVMETEPAMSIVVFRQGLYQVELYLAKPGIETGRHAHNADQITFYLGGSYGAEKGKGSFNNEPLGRGIIGHPDGRNQDNPDLPHRDAGKMGSLLPAGHWHALTAFNNGFMFLVAQKWNSKEEMYSAFTDWVGESLGPMHDSLIEKTKKMAQKENNDG